MRRRRQHAIENEEASTTVCGLPRAEGRRTVVVGDSMVPSSLFLCEMCESALYERELAEHTRDAFADKARSSSGPYDLGRVGRSGARTIAGGGFESSRRRH